MRRFVFALFFLLVPTLLLAQDDPLPAAVINWWEVAALAINTVGVTVAVQATKWYLPRLRSGVKPLLTLVWGPLLLMAQSALGDVLGFPIDFGALVDVIGAGMATGAAATVPFMVGKSQGRRPRRP